MNKRSLPPLNAVRAFEAVGRHLSISRAAVELCVTESAVSQQVKLLERYLGLQLFVRHPGRLEATPNSKFLLPLLGQSFDQIDSAFAAVRGTDDRKLRVQLTPHLSAYWFTPRLASFMSKFPHIEVSVTHTYDRIDHLAPKVDLAVAWDVNAWKGSTAKPLIQLGYLPMCSPTLLSRNVASFENLLEHPLIQERGTTLWKDWFRAAALPMPKFSRIIEFDNYDVAVHAAVQGQGLAILMFPMFRDLIATGQLMTPFGTEIFVPITCSLLYTNKAIERPEVRCFRDWIIEEAAEGFSLKDRSAAARQGVNPE